MLYVKPLTIPKNTSKAEPASVQLVCTAGKVTEVEILFPSGCMGLVGVRIRDFEHIVWPTNPDEWLIASGETVEWDEDYDLAGTPWTLTLEGYSDDDTYPWTIYFRFAVMEIGKAALVKSFWDWVRGW